MAWKLALSSHHYSFESPTSASPASCAFTVYTLYTCTDDHTCVRPHTRARVYTPLPHTSRGVAAERGLTDRDCWVIQANMIDFMITLKPQLVFMLSRNAKSFQRKSGRESGMKGTRGRKALQLLSLQSPPPSLPSSLTVSPLALLMAWNYGPARATTTV